MRSTILLFDIDGTLIDTGGAGRRAMEATFAEHFGRDDACAHIAFGGMTDRAILRAALEAIGREADAAMLASLVATYLRRLAAEMARTRDLRVHAGVREVLAHAATREGYAIGLGTGNVREGAKLKLGPVGLFEAFAFGGFGCDSEDRAELLRIGAERGAAIAGAPITACRVVIIGDTPRDVAAARAIGAESFAVASGSHTTDDLAACGADCVVASLGDARAIDALLK